MDRDKCNDFYSEYIILIHHNHHCAIIHARLLQLANNNIQFKSSASHPNQIDYNFCYCSTHGCLFCLMSLVVIASDSMCFYFILFKFIFALLFHCACVCLCVCMMADIIHMPRICIQFIKKKKSYEKYCNVR